MNFPDYKDMLAIHTRNNTSYWTSKHGTVYKVKDMTTPHIKNCIVMICNNPGWRDEYLQPFLHELSSRHVKYILKDSCDNTIKVCTSFKEAEQLKFIIGNSSWRIETEHCDIDYNYILKRIKGYAFKY